MRGDACARHERCVHAQACRRVVCLPTVVVVALDVASCGVIGEALLCDCCPVYEERRREPDER